MYAAGYAHNKLEITCFVIPAKLVLDSDRGAGNQENHPAAAGLDSRLQGSDGFGDFLRA